MAPNRKQLSLLSVELENVVDDVQPKFLPLTHPQEEQKHLEQKEEQPRQEQVDSASYWDWGTTEDEKVAPVDIFSASYIEANLIRESQKLQEKKVINNTSSNVNGEDYWAEKVEDVVASSSSEDDANVVKVVAPQHEQVNYWDWPEDTNQFLIQSILLDEFARKMVSAETIQQNLVAESSSLATKSAAGVVVAAKKESSQGNYWDWESPVVANHVHDASHPHHCYWDWKEGSKDNDLEKSDILKSIVEEERVRQLLSVSHIEQMETKNATKVVSASSCCASDDYWTWSSPSKDAETANYWDWENANNAPTQSESYWVM